MPGYIFSKLINKPFYRDTLYRWHPVDDGDMTPELFFELTQKKYEPEAMSILGQLQVIFAEMEFGNSK